MNQRHLPFISCWDHCQRFSPLQFSIQIHVATTYFSKQKQNILKKCQGMMQKFECSCWLYQNKHILVLSCQLELEGK